MRICRGTLRLCRLRTAALSTLLIACGTAQAITVTAPGLNPAHLRTTVFADNLNYPVGMATLDDGSLLVATTNGADYFAAATGSILRLVDADRDGVAETRQTLVADVPGGKVSALRRAGNLVAVTGQGAGSPISIYRLGASLSDPLVRLGGVTLNYPSGSWLHPHSALALRQNEADPNRYELYFQLGSDRNLATTTRTVTLSGDFGVAGSLAGDSIHRLELTDGVGGLTAGPAVRIASGLRNATGMAFDPATGDLYLGENGVDGLVNINEPHSADEIDVILAAELGVATPDFGFPSTYVSYRTGVIVGSTGRQPVATFQPVPPPNGSEAEGVNEIAYSPPLFPAPLAEGLFAGFHGRFFAGGIANEENPLVFLDLRDGSYFHAVSNDDPTVGHLDGLWTTRDTLFVADASTQGGFSGTAENSGKIFAVTSLLALGDYLRNGDVDGADLLAWQRQLGNTTGAYYLADGDGSRLVDAGDLTVWETYFGLPAAVAGRPLPEPGGFALLSTAVALVSAGRRRAPDGVADGPFPTGRVRIEKGPA